MPIITSVTKKRARRRIITERAPMAWVDYHANAQDLQCVMLAALGWTTAAIAKQVRLTEGQVVYRISKSEFGRRKGELTARTQYRQGKSDIAQAMVVQISGNRSPVRRFVVATLDKRGLYSPRPRGVMKDD